MALRRQGVGAGTRWAYAGQVALAIALAVGAAFLAIDVADANFVRADLTRQGINTLDPALADQIEKLPEPCTVDVFFRPLRPPYDRVWSDAANRMQGLLFTARNAHRDKLKVVVHQDDDLAAERARQAELGISGINLVVVSCGDRRDAFPLFGAAVDVDWGRPTSQGVAYLHELGIDAVGDFRSFINNPNQRFVPARVSLFHGGEVLAQSLKKVSATRSPRVYVSQGHGEPALDGTLPEGLDRLRRALELDGFEVFPWDPAKTPRVPEDADVLAVLGPAQPLPAGTAAAVEDFVEHGGAAILAPSELELERGFEHGVSELMRPYGQYPVAGQICQAVVDRSGQSQQGNPACAILTLGENGLNASNPLTVPLRQRGRKVEFHGTHSFEFRTETAFGGAQVIKLISAPRGAWRDLPPYDYVFDERVETRSSSRFALALQSRVPLAEATVGGPRRTDVLGVAGTRFFTNNLFDKNRDFLLNAFNQLARRDYRVGVSPRTREPSLLDVTRGTALAKLSYSLWLGLPGSFMLIGAVVAWRRRR